MFSDLHHKLHWKLHNEMCAPNQTIRNLVLGVLLSRDAEGCFYLMWLDNIAKEFNLQSCDQALCLLLGSMVNKISWWTILCRRGILYWKNITLRKTSHFSFKILSHSEK